MRPYARNLKQPARQLRSGMTEAEQLLWQHLRRKQVMGIQFYRQKPIGPFIVDFYAPAAGIVVEVDGSQHHEQEHVRKDAERDSSLAESGLLVLRYDNHQVLAETQTVLDDIFNVCAVRLKSPLAPPLSKGGD